MLGLQSGDVVKVLNNSVLTVLFRLTRSRDHLCALERGYFVVYQCFFFVKSGQTIVFMRNKYTFQSYCHVSCILLVGAG